MKSHRNRKGNSALPCVHVQSSPEGHRETMNMECPRVYLNGSKCAHCSVPVFDSDAQRDKLQVKGSHSCMRIDECPACAPFCLELQPECLQARNYCLPSSDLKNKKRVAQFIRIRKRQQRPAVSSYTVIT